MRKIGIQEIEDIALGASLLGAGGGGDPYVGKLMAIGAIKEFGAVTLLDPDEVPDDAFVVPIAMMGAPSVLAEKAIGANEYKTLHDMVMQYYGREIFAFMPIEAGGVNSMLPFLAGAKLGIPVVDADGMGRAFPELQMVTFTMAGVNATPMALTDEKGNSVIFKTITNKWTEELARAVTMSCGGSVSVSLYCMDGKIVKDYGVHGIVTRSEKLGKAIREVKNGTGTPEENFLAAAEGFKLFRGKIVDVLREVRGAFNFGKVILEGIGEYKGHVAHAEFRNENLLAAVDAARTVSAARLLAGIGIPGIGAANAKVICRHFLFDWEKIAAATAAELLEIDGIGDVLAENYVAWFADAENKAQLSEILSQITFDPAEQTAAQAGNGLAGLTFVITGALETYPNREALKEEIESHGGKVTGSVSEKTSYLINNDAASASSKNKKAQALGVKIITEEEYKKLL